MKTQRRPKEFFDGLSESPVVLKPFDPASKARSNIYRISLNQLLAPLGATAVLFGSVELEIATKGEWEFAIYLDDAHWYPVLVKLINHFGKIYTLLDDFAVFEDVFEGTPIEVIPMRGESLQRNQAIMDFWSHNPAALKEYEQGKLLHAYSRREYYRWKDEFIAGVVEKL
jgi:hypothetical protein